MSSVRVLQIGDINLSHTDNIGKDTSEKSIKTWPFGL